MLAHAWDGSPETITVPHCAERVLPILREEGHPALLTDLTSHQSESDAESSDLEEEAMDPLKGLQTRKEAKALEREVPWRSMLRLPPEQIVAYIKFNRKEETGWQKWGSIEPNPDDEEDKDSSQETPSFEKQGMLPQQEPRSQQADRKDSGSCSRSPRPRPLQGGTRFTDTFEDI